MRPRRPLVAALLAIVPLVAAALVSAGPATADAKPAPRRTVAAASSSTDWIQYHGNSYRTGYATSMPTYRGGLHVVKQLPLDGAVYAQPLVVGGLTIVATENNTVYAFNSANALVWKHHLGTPSPRSERQCGDIDPLGITGTPVYYSGTHDVYVAAEFTHSPSPTHRVYGLNVSTGRMDTSTGIDVSGVDAGAMQQRGALALARGRVWVPFGAQAGDCGDYKGRVVGSSVHGGSVISYTNPTKRGGGMWNVAGPTVDPDGNLFTIAANGAAFPGDNYDYTNSIIKVSGANAHRLDSFAPSIWAQNNQGDVGLGSQGATFVRGFIFIAGKSNPAYVVRRTHLGGIGGQVSSANVCFSYGGTAVVGNTVFVPCTDGVRAVYVDPAGRMHLAWRNTSATASPVYGGGIIWTLNPSSGLLEGIGLHDGARHVTVSVGSGNRFSTPAISGKRILIGTLSGLTVLSS